MAGASPPLLTLAMTQVCAGCDDTLFFTAGRDAQVCEDTIPTACGRVARCVLDTDHYLEGTFPGSRRFIVRTGGEADLHFEMFFDDCRTPGTLLRLEVAEPNCSDTHSYDSAGKDIFRDTGSDGVLYLPIHVTRPGDHLVDLTSDAYCSYLLKFDF